MLLWMRGMRTMRPIHEGFSSTIITFIPAHQRSFWDFVLSTDERNGIPGTISFYCVLSGCNFMWQISLSLWYTFHSDWHSFSFVFVVITFYWIQSLFSILFCLTSIVALHLLKKITDNMYRSQWCETKNIKKTGRKNPPEWIPQREHFSMEYFLSRTCREAMQSILG